jgi:hypothetical protein
LDTRVGRLVIGEFADPARLVRLGPRSFRAFAARRGVIVQAKIADRLVATAHQVLPNDQAAIARRVLIDDLALLAGLDTQIDAIGRRLTELLAQTRFQILATVPGWGTVRVASYAAAVGDLARWPSPRQLYRAAGLTPAVAESAGRRQDRGITREGSVALRRALLGLGVGLWRCDPAARAYGAALRARGKHGGVIATALAQRANRIAFAMVRDQTGYDPTGGGDSHPSQPLPRVPGSSAGRPDQTPYRLWRTPGLRRRSLGARPPAPIPEPERGQLTLPTGRGRIGQRGPVGPTSAAQPSAASSPTALRRESQRSSCRQTLDSPYSQLAPPGRLVTRSSGASPRAVADAVAPSPGGCRCAEGGTPDPCPRDHPARPGVKVEPPQPPAGRLAIGVGGEEARPSSYCLLHQAALSTVYGVFPDPEASPGWVP